MAIIEDILKNKTLAKTISQNSTNLNNKLVKLQKIMENINTAWPESMSEKKYIFQALNESGTGIAHVGTKYYLYADNISAAVDLLKDQLPWKGLVGSTKTVKFKKCTPKKPNSEKLKVNTTELRKYGNQLVTLGTDIYNIELASYQQVSVVVSNTIINLVSSQLGSLSSLNKKLDTYANRIKKVGTTIVSICDKYDSAESNVKKVMEELNKGSANITYGDGSVQDVEDLKNQGWTFNLSIAGAYTIANNIQNNISQASGKDNIIKAIQERDATLSKNNGSKTNSAYDGLCSTLVKDKITKLTGQNYILGDGKQVYNSIKKYYETNGKNGKYAAESISGSDALNTLINNHEGEVLTNVVVTYTRREEAGHALYIDRIENGMIYYSDSFSAGQVKNTATAISVSDFINIYKQYGYTMTGVNYLYSKE